MSALRGLYRASIADEVGVTTGGIKVVGFGWLVVAGVISLVVGCAVSTFFTGTFVSSRLTVGISL